jgi:tetratricopeptide (TPR) repeat protein
MFMTASKLPLLLLLVTFVLPAEATQTGRSSAHQSKADDELARHVSAAETYQLSGDLERAGLENRAIVSIGLARLGAIAIRERQLQRAVQLLGNSLSLRDDSQVRTDLAIAYMRLLDVERAVTEALAAVTLEEKNARARHVLGKLLYMKGDYAGAREQLERAVVLKPDLDAAYTLGMTYLRLKDSARAKLLFEEMQAALKNSADAHLLFGRAYEETGFAVDAEKEFRAALAIDPRSPRANFYLGYVIFKHGGNERVAQAGEAFDRQLQLTPNDFFANFFRGVVAATVGDQRKAVERLTEATRIKPDAGHAHLFLGQSQAELGLPGAEKSLRRAIELTPDVSKNSFQIKRAHYLLGRVLLKTGRRQEAEKELAIARDLQTQSLESSRQEVSEILNQVTKSSEGSTSPSQMVATNPGEDNSDAGEGRVLLNEESALNAGEKQRFQGLKNNLGEVVAQAYHNLGVIAAQQNRLADALQQFDSAAEFKADLAGLDRNRGIVAFRTNQYEKAAKLLAQHLKSNPQDAFVRRMLGVSYYLIQDFRQVVTTLKPLESKITDDPELAYSYGISLVQVAEHQTAAAVFARLAAARPKDAQSRFYAGQGFMVMQDYARALTEFRTAAELDARLAQAHYNAGQSLIRLNRLDEAEREFRQELSLNPSDEASKYHLAYVLLEQKRQIPEALLLLREVVASRPNHGDARYQLGKTLIEQGDIAGAVENLEAAARAEPQKDYIRYQLSIAYRRASRTTEAERELQLYKELKAANRMREQPLPAGVKQNVP